MRWVRDHAPEPAAMPPRDPGAVEVQTLTLVREDAPVIVRGYGSLQPRRTAAIASELGGTLERVHPGWRDGAWLPAGEELFAIDTRELLADRARLEALAVQATAELDRARAALQLAERSRALASEVLAARQREEDRWQGLSDRGHGEEARLDAALAARAAAAQGVADVEAAVSTAAAEVAAAEGHQAEVAAGAALTETRIGKAVVTTPFAGRLVGTAPAVGHHVVRAATIVELIDTSVLRLVLHVPEGEALSIRLGQSARVEIFDGSGVVRMAQVAAVGARADESTRSVPIEIDLDNAAPGSDASAPPPLPAGLFAAAAVEVRELAGTLLINRAHVAWRAGRPTAFVVVSDGAGQHAEARQLVLGRALEDRFVVRTGLAPGEQLITSSLRFLGDGALVRTLAPDGDAR